MSYLTTELLTSLLRGGTAANEFLRSKIEEGVNAVLKAELAGFLGYEKHSSAGWHTGNSHNRSYQRTIVTSYGKIAVEVPRDRNGEFQSPLLPCFLSSGFPHFRRWNSPLSSWENPHFQRALSGSRFHYCILPHEGSIR